MASPEDASMQDTVSILRQRLADRRKAIGTLRGTGEFPTGSGAGSTLQEHGSGVDLFETTGRSGDGTPLRRSTLPVLTRDANELSVVNSPLRMSHLQPLDEGGRGADLPAPILGQHQGSPSSEFASLRERMASVKRAPRQASLDQQGTGGEDDSMATMSSDLRDRLRAQVSSAKMKTKQKTQRASAPSQLQEAEARDGSGQSPKSRKNWKKAVNFAGQEEKQPEGQHDASYDFFMRPTGPPMDSELSWPRRRKAPDAENASDAADRAKGGEVHIAMPLSTAEQRDGLGRPRQEQETSALLGRDQLRTPREAGLVATGSVSVDDSDLVEQGFAMATSLRQQLALEEKLYFQPSDVYVPETEKIPSDHAPRYPDQEGLFTGHNPPMSLSNQAIVENRLLKQGSQSLVWFGKDGRLICLPNPVKEWPERQVDWWLGNDGDAPRMYFHPAQLDPDTRLSELQSRQWCLTLNVDSVRFSHHPLFSVEHVLASRLLQYFSAYTLRKAKNSINFLTDKLKALKTAAAQLHVTLATGGTELDALATSKQLADYQMEIRRTRQLRDGESATEKQLIKNMFGCWMQMKSLRHSQGYTSTGLKLILKKDNVNKEQDQQKWQEEIDEEVEELRVEADKLHQDQMAEYRRHKALYRSYKQQIENSTTDQGQAAPITQQAVPKPKKPTGFDEEACRSLVTENALKNRRRPGNPIITPHLETDLPLTAITSCPRNEQARRREVQRQSYFVRVMIDEREAGQSRSKCVEQDFVIHFNDSINTYPGRWPGSVVLQVVEDSYLQSRQISEVFLPVPSRHVSVETATAQRIEFSAERRVSPSMLTAVGSGSVSVPVVQANTSTEEMQYEVRELLTSADIHLVCGWNVDPITGRTAAPPEFDEEEDNESKKHHHGDAIGALGMAGIVDAKKLASWIDEARLDPNDPRNLDLLQSVKEYTAQGKNALHSFRLSALERSTHFATDTQLNSDRRFRLIKIRSDQEARKSQRSQKPITVPTSAGQVTALQLHAAAEEDETPNQPVDEVYSISARRRRGQQLLMEAKRRVYERTQSMQGQVRREHVVQEDPTPDVGSFILSILSLMNPFGAVEENKERIAQRAVQSVATSGSACVRVEILRANRLPQRANSSANELQHTVRGGRKKAPATLRPYVEVSFQREKQRTEVAEGTDPEWNDTMTFQLVGEESRMTTLQGLQSLDDLVYFNLFDEELVDLLQDERKRDTNIHQRIQRHWLGSFSLPLQTLLARSQVSGTFQLQVPLVLLDYHLYQPEERVLPWWLQRESQRLDRPCLTVNITLEPKLAPLPSIHITFESREEHRVLKASRQWTHTLSSKFPARQNYVTAVDLNGRTVLVTRYIAKQCPPSQVCQHQPNTVPTMKHLERAAHFVSMIPFVPDTTAFSGTCDLWSTSQEFLQMLSGDEEEHAVLLCNYFLHMKQQAWVLVGSAIPEGDTAFVLVSSYNPTGKVEYHLWKPSTGEHFRQYDTLCPLQDVYFVFNDTNVWANVQSSTKPSQITFDLSSTSNWRPFFTSSFPAPDLTSIQSEHLVYEVGAETFGQELEVVLEQRLMSELMGWREQQVTHWNRYCSRGLKELLPRFEANPYDIPVSTSNEHLRNILKSYRLTGFPLHMPFTDVSSVVETLHSTGLHLNDDPKVEFALAVYAHVYPNEVVSLWVYVANIFKR
ncbi:coiled-coil and C2 domain-containing protein 2A-like [Sycon ciliatum]|uniref:coiled-coil and C2 domain-containing protein 2A-like n=1 Tax=Sycon ciliatum TaxID=27933 RepID=UPI0031F70324